MSKKYTIVQTINDSHKVYLVKSLQDNCFYVKKTLDYYDKNVYTWLSSHKINGIPSIKEINEIGGKLVIIEEYVAGRTLESILNTKGKLSENEVKQIIIAVCNILKHVTDEIPLVHRDIKPSNIIIKDSGELYLIDFNTSKIIYETKSRDTVLLGTEGYAAPEQYGFAASNIQTDIYAIGVMMNELLTGSIDLNNNYSGCLKPIIQKCTMIDPKTRYTDYMSLIKQLKHRYVFNNKYLPVGFRRGNAFSICLSIIWYTMILFMSSGLEVEGSSGINLLIDRVGFAFSLIAITLFSGNYLNCQKIIGIQKIKNRFLRIAAIILADFVLFFIVLIFAVFIDAII